MIRRLHLLGLIRRRSGRFGVGAQEDVVRALPGAVHVHHVVAHAHGLGARGEPASGRALGVRQGDQTSMNVLPSELLPVSIRRTPSGRRTPTSWPGAPTWWWKVIWWPSYEVVPANPRLSA